MGFDDIVSSNSAKVSLIHVYGVTNLINLNLNLNGGVITHVSIG